MNQIITKVHFGLSEFLKSKTLPFDFEPEGQVYEKIKWWILVLSPIRDILGFAITITDRVRLHKGEESRGQHYYNESWSIKGAVDIRPSDREDSEKFMRLAMVLAAHPAIKRVCYYLPSERFPSGGFHCDNKGDEKVLFINEGKAINWQRVSSTVFVAWVGNHGI